MNRAHKWLHGALVALSVLLSLCAAWHLEGVESAGAAMATQVQQARHLLAWGGLFGALAIAAGVYAGRVTRRRETCLLNQFHDLERLAMVARRTESAVVITDVHGHVTWANEAFTRSSGYEPEELLGHRPGALLQFDRADEASRELIRANMALRKPMQADVLNRSKQGRLYWVHLDIQPTQDSNGQPTGFIAVEFDITSQVLERERLASLLRALPAGVVHHDEQGRLVDANPEACRILGLSRNQLLGSETINGNWINIREDGSDFPPDDNPVKQALRTGEPVRDVMMGVTLPGGERRWLRVNAELVESPGGGAGGVVSCFLDVTEVSAQRRMLALTVDAAGLGTWDWNLPADEVRFNERWWQMLGYRPGAVPPNMAHWEALVHPQDLPQVKRAFQHHFDHPAEHYHCEFRILRASGQWTWLMAAGSAIERQPNGTPRRVVGIHLDITQRKVLEQRLADAARTDALTGLPNRVALQARLAKCTARARRHPGAVYAVLFMDFDRFKQVNDSLGHEAGDELLRQVAQRLRDALRRESELAGTADDSFCAARLGGDEFVVLLEQLKQPDDAKQVAQRLLDTLAAPYQLAGRDVRSTASIGIVGCNRADHDPSALLRDADIAMYEAKRQGRARFVVFSPDMQERIQATITLESDLRRALASRGEVFVVYQPIVCLTTGTVLGVEALARWTHPIRGPVPPVEFIALAEENGLIAELGEYVLRSACQDAAAWRSTLGHLAPTAVSVNLSRAQIRKGDLLATVSAVLARTNLPPSALRLEITESLAMQDVNMVHTLQALRDLGVSLALDDFGTGYSSLATLDQLPLDALKIDRSFVQRMVGSTYQTALVEATLKVAATLGLEVVAEGVETAEQAEMLRKAGCRLAQGWLLGRPGSAQQLCERIRETQTHAESQVLQT